MFLWSCHKLGINAAEEFPQLWESLQVVYATIASERDPNTMFEESQGSQGSRLKW